MKRRLACLLLVLACLPAATAWAAVDPFRDDQWALTKIDATQAWGTAKGAGVTIAIVDSGIDLTHPDLRSKIVSGWNCLDACVSGGDDDNGHGSHVAGIAAAATDNGVGVAGVAPSAKLMAVKVLDANGEGFVSDIARGIRWAADKGARVVNLSLGPDVPLVLDPLGSGGAMRDAVNYAWNKGAVVVAAAGNDALPATFYTGTANMLVVGATGPNDELADYSNAGLDVDVYAPGGNSTGPGCPSNRCILSAWKDGQYANAEGTSMSAPHVSGIAALLLGQGRSNSEARSRITSTTEDTPDGLPRVNAAKAVGAPAGGGNTGGGGGGSGGGGGNGGSGGSGGNNNGGSRSPSPGASGSPRGTTSPGGTPSTPASGAPTEGGAGGPRAQGTPGNEGPGPGSLGAGFLVLLGITGALYASHRLRRRASP